MNICLWNRDAQFADQLQNMLSEYFGAKNLPVRLERLIPDSESLCTSSGCIDLLFLDIQMSDLNAAEAASILRRVKPGFDMVLVSDTPLDQCGECEDDVLWIARSNPEKSFETCMERIIRRKHPRKKRMEFRFVNGSHAVHLDQICYIESQLHKAIFHFITPGEPPRFMYETLDRLEESIHSADMLRVHQSYLVNKRCIRNLSRYLVLLQDGRTLPVSKRRYAFVRESLQNS